MLASCFTMGKSHEQKTFPKYGTRLDCHLVEVRLFWGCFHPRALHHTKYQQMHYELEIQSDSLDDKEKWNTQIILSLSPYTKNVRMTIILKFFTSNSTDKEED